MIQGKICLPITDFDFDKVMYVHKIAQKSPWVEYIEYRIDFCEKKENISNIIATCPVHSIVTNRRSGETGRFDGTIDESLDYLLLASNTHAWAIDIEQELYDRTKTQYTQNKIDTIRTNSKLIISFHDSITTPPIQKLQERIYAMMMLKPDIIKIACMVTHQQQCTILYTILQWMHKEYPRIPAIIIGMGELGRETRILCPQYGSLLTFAKRDTQGSAPGQIDIHEMENLLNSKK